MVKKHNPKTSRGFIPTQQEELQQQVNSLLNARKEASGVYKSTMQGLLVSIDNLFKIDNTLLGLFIKPTKE